ncbi:stage II sporulation protein M [Thermococcus stetteri]|uniref:stage II sporulation protein M n=1 Tax=Thermococcus stetteri TaxID=49900 RepID=UPI001AE5F555|nr:stage II sporulation protein M [Thermococcus stetteri]MBP1912461.1 stage II sporulation protein M [Thermococcus stetteri]
MSRISRYFLYLLAVFFVGIAVGLAYSKTRPGAAIEYMERLARQFGGISDDPFKNFVKIFLNNAKVALLVIVAGLFFGVGSGFVIFANGFIVGLVVGVLKERGIPVKTLILGLVPHGIIEVPAILLAGAAGMCWYRRIIDEEDKGKGFKEGALRALRLYLVVLVMLLIAAFIEAYVTPNVANLG